MKPLWRLLCNPGFLIGSIYFTGAVCLALFAPFLANKEDALRIGTFPTALRPGEKSVFIVDTTVRTQTIVDTVVIVDPLSGAESRTMIPRLAERIRLDSSWQRVSEVKSRECTITRVHWLGTNSLGQDMGVRLLYGLRASLYVGLLAAFIATTLGTAVGILSGYKGGTIDHILSAMTNLFIVIPAFLVIILVSSILEKRSLTLVALIIGLISWSWTARSVRAQTASLRGREHIALAKLNGYGTGAILWRQILPYIMSYVFVAAVVQMSTGILNEAAISMIGLGPYDTVTLGMILNDAQRSGALMNNMWWVFIPPVLVITFLQFSLYLMNTAMETVFNPRLRKN